MESYSGKEFEFEWLSEDFLEAKQTHLLLKTDRYNNSTIEAEIIPGKFPKQAEMIKKRNRNKIETKWNKFDLN